MQLLGCWEKRCQLLGSSFRRDAKRFLGSATVPKLGDIGSKLLDVIGLAASLSLRGWRLGAWEAPKLTSELGFRLGEGAVTADFCNTGLADSANCKIPSLGRVALGSRVAAREASGAQTVKAPTRPPNMAAWRAISQGILVLASFCWHCCRAGAVPSVEVIEIDPFITVITNEPVYRKQFGGNLDS